MPLSRHEEANLGDFGFHHFRRNIFKIQEKTMKLSAPTQIVFLISLVIAIVGILVALAVIPSLPISAFWIVVVGYVVLALGCLLKRV